MFICMRLCMHMYVCVCTRVRLDICKSSKMTNDKIKATVSSGSK